MTSFTTLAGTLRQDGSLIDSLFCRLLYDVEPWHRTTRCHFDGASTADKVIFPPVAETWLVEYHRYRIYFSIVSVGAISLKCNYFGNF